MTFLSGQDDFFQTANQPISVRHLSEPYNKKLLLTERKVCTEKYRTEVSLVQTEQARLIKSLLYGVWHLELKQTKNCEIETNKKYFELKRAACMHDLAQHKNEINNKLHNFLNLFMNNL